MRQSDISFALTAVLQSMSPGGAAAIAAAGVFRSAGGGAADIRAPSLTYTAATREAKRAVRIPVSLYRVAFLGIDIEEKIIFNLSYYIDLFMKISALKIMLVCFESDLVSDWGRIARAMRELGKRNEAAPILWNFLEFVVTHRTPLYILLLPFIIHKVRRKISIS